MSKKIIKQDIEDLKRILNNQSTSNKSDVFADIELFTEIFGSTEYENYKKAVIDGKTDISNSIIDSLPYTKRPVFKQLLEYDLEYFDKL